MILSLSLGFILMSGISSGHWVMLLVMMLLVISLVSRVMISVISSASGGNVVNIFIVQCIG